MNISFKEDNNSKEWFNHTLSQEVYKITKGRSNLEVLKNKLSKILPLPEDVKIDSASSLVFPSHKLLGKKLKELSSGKVFLVEKVCLQFYGGWHYGVLLNCEGSHCFRYFENHSCIETHIVQETSDFWNKFVII